jgi:hypothetical protein
VLLGEGDPRAAIAAPEGLGFDLLPGNGDLTAAEVALQCSGFNREGRAEARAGSRCAARYDYDPHRLPAVAEHADPERPVAADRAC